MSTHRPPAFLRGRPKAYRQFFALALLVCCALAVLVLIVQPTVGSISSNQQEISRLTDLIPRAARARSLEESTLNGWADFESKINRMNVLVSEPRAAIALSQMEENIRQKAEANGVAIVNLLPKPPGSSARLRLLPISLEMTGTPSAITALIFDLENTSPIMRFERIEWTVPSDDFEPTVLKADLIGFSLTPRAETQ